MTEQDVLLKLTVYKISSVIIIHCFVKECCTLHNYDETFIKPIL